MKSFPDHKISVVIAAAGSGSRANFNKNKIFMKSGGEAVIYKTVKAFDLDCISQIVVAAKKSEIDTLKTILSPIGDKVVYAEGKSARGGSVRSALEKVTGDIVLIHDGARPYVSKDLIERCILSVIYCGSGVSAISLTDTVAVKRGGVIEKSLDRSELVALQTPQAFFTKDILSAYRKSNGDFTDDSALYLKYIGEPKLVEGDAANIKLTYEKDFKSTMNYYTGIGFDTHRLVKDRKLILGGVEIEHDLGLSGHSDADALIHAVMDALLSSAGLRDIGYHFNNQDGEYKDISSIELLKRVSAMLEKKSYNIKNISAVIIAEKPKLAPYIDKMSQNIARVLHISTECVGITCSTSEKMGFVGRCEGITVHASCLTYK